MLGPRRPSNMVSTPTGSPFTQSNDGACIGDPTPCPPNEHARVSVNEDVLQLMEKQFLYINQLEEDTAKNGQELMFILDKVEEVVAENEALHEQPAGGRSRIESNLIRDSRLVEMETQLLHSKRSLRLAQEEVLELRKQLDEQPRPPLTKFPICDLHVAEIENLSRERNDLVGTIGKLQQSVQMFKEREKEATEKVRSSLELVEQMRREKTKDEAEAKELKDEVIHLNQRVRELITETSQKLTQGKLEAEKSCEMEMKRLKVEYNHELESSMKAKLELDSLKRLERELKKDLCGKDRAIFELRQQMQLKIDTLQTHLSQTIQQKTRVETDLMSMRLQAEKIERQGKQETSRLNAELMLIRKRFAESESDLKKSGEAILLLNRRISDLDRNLVLADKASHDRELVTNEQIMKFTAEAVQQKYAGEKWALEGVIQKQNELMDKLRGECYQLAQKLEEASSVFKKERAEMFQENTRLSHCHSLTEKKCKDLEQKVEFYAIGQEQMINRLHSLEVEEKAHTQKMVTLVKKQRLLQSEKQKLLGEVAVLRSQSQRLTQQTPS